MKDRNPSVQFTTPVGSRSRSKYVSPLGPLLHRQTAVRSGLKQQGHAEHGQNEGAEDLH